MVRSLLRFNASNYCTYACIACIGSTLDMRGDQFFADAGTERSSHAMLMCIGVAKALECIVGGRMALPIALASWRNFDTFNAGQAMAATALPDAGSGI